MQKLGFLKKLSLLLNESSFDQYVREFKTGQDVSPSILTSGHDNALKYSVFFACLRVLAETFACVPVFEYQKQANGDRIQTDDTGLYPILHDQSNEETSAYNFAECMMYQLNCGGNAIAFRQENTLGGLAGLMQIEWERIRITRNKGTQKLEYIVDGDRESPLSREQVFHVPGPSQNGVIGMSILEYAASAINLGQSYETFGNNFFKNGAIPSGIFEHPGKMNDESYKRLKESLKEEYTGLKNAGTPMLLEDSLKYNQLTMKLVDAEFLSSRKFQAVDASRYTRVPLHMINELERATNNNIEHQSLEFIIYTMLPHFKRFEGAIQSQLLTKRQRDAGYYFEYNITSLVRGDLKSRYEAYSQGRMGGFLSVNDIRRFENQPKIPNGDIYLQPSNMIEAGKVPEIPLSPSVKKEIDDLMKLSEVRNA